MGRGQAASAIAKDQFSEIFGNRRGGGRPEEEARLDGEVEGTGSPGSSREDIEFDDGSALEYPSAEGFICLRDEHGESVGGWYPDDPQWEEYAKLFGVTASDFEDDEDEDA